MATLTLRPEVVAASLPLTMQDAPERHAPPLAADDAFRVLQQLRAEGRSLREPGLARYGTWISASWHALAWPEPSARLVWELVALLGGRGGGARGLAAAVRATDLALFTLVHCRHDDAVGDAPASSFEERFPGPASPPRKSSDASDDGAPSPPPTSPPASPRAAADAPSLELSVHAHAGAEARHVAWARAAARDLARIAARSADDAATHPPGTLARGDLAALDFLLVSDAHASVADAAPAELFDGLGAASIDDVAAWLAATVASDGDAPSMSPRDKWSEHAGSPGRTARSGAVTIAPGATTVHVCDAKRCTRVVERRGGGGSERTSCAVHNCRDSRVYVLADVTVCSVVGCVDCVVVVGACATVLRAVACERVKIVCAAGRVVLRNCLGCDVLAYTPAPILLAGDARSCRVGPFGLCYPGLERDVAAAGLDGGDANLWRHPLLVSAVAKAPFASHTAPDALPVPPAEFDVVRGPRRGAGDGGAPRVPFGLPAEYAAAVDARDARAAEVRRKIADADLGPAQRDALEATTRACFAKWLVENRGLKDVVELLQLDGPPDGAP